ncbi:unnamed protein product, partial [marine sediment metagenome]
EPDVDCEAIVIDVWLHNSYLWQKRKLPKVGLTVDAWDGQLRAVLYDSG